MNFSAVTENRVFKLLKATASDWMEDGALRLSAALAYYSIFSIAPLLIIAISLAGLFFGEEAARGQITQQMQSYVGPQAAEAVQTMVQGASKKSDGWLGTVIGFATLMLGASGVFGQLKDALNTIWEVKAKGGAGIWGFLRERLLNFGMVLVIGFLLLTSLMLTAALAALGSVFHGISWLPQLLSGVVAFVVSFGVVTALFAFIFKMLPDAEIEWRNVWIGAVVTALLFEVGKFGLGFYLGRPSTASGFGAAGAVVLLLLWVYYASCILLFGAEFTQVYSKDLGHEIKPAPGAEAVTAEARAQQGLPPQAPPPAEHAVVRREVRVVTVPVENWHPVATLMAVVAGSFLVGMLARRPEAKIASPGKRIRGGLADLGGLAAGEVENLLGRARDGLARVRK